VAAVIREDDIDFGEYMAETDPKAKMRPASAYRDRVKQRLIHGVKFVGTPAPWAKTEDKIRFREGETTLWAGVNGSGKSLLLGQVILGFMRGQKRCAIASFEMKPETTLQRMCLQASQGGKPSEMFIDRFHDWTDGRLWLYDHQGQIRPEQMLAVCRFAHRELQIKHVVIDSLMKVIRGEDDYNAQKDFIDAITAIGRDTGMHLHIVHHLRKGDGSGRPGSKDDVKGSGSITDQVDNVVIVWRNKAKKAEESEDGKNPPDAMMIVDKQRNGEWEGRINLWFDPDSTQYLGSPDDRAQEFIGGLL
jgi:twinkle protein